MYATVCLVVLYLGLIVFSFVAAGKQALNANAPTPSLTATVVKTPQIVVHTPEDDWAIRHEDFSRDVRAWSIYYPPGKLQIINGYLVLEAYNPGRIIIATSRDYFSPSAKRYYVQADFTVDSETSLPYGLVFGLNRSLGTFYFFGILPEENAIQLEKHDSGGWESLVPLTEVELNPYPEFNTLSVYFDEGDIELYVNGILAATYLDENLLQSKDIGGLMSDAGVRLIMDNFFVYDDR